MRGCALRRECTSTRLAGTLRVWEKHVAEHNGIVARRQKVQTPSSISGSSKKKQDCSMGIKLGLLRKKFAQTRVRTT